MYKFQNAPGFVGQKLLSTKNNDEFHGEGILSSNKYSPKSSFDYSHGSYSQVSYMNKENDLIYQLNIQLLKHKNIISQERISYLRKRRKKLQMWRMESLSNYRHLDYLSIQKFLFRKRGQFFPILGIYFQARQLFAQVPQKNNKHYQSQLVGLGLVHFNST